jgi:hypothetical protein
MSSTISNALLAALETTFGPKVVSSEPKSTVKKPWPGPWIQKPKKQLYTQRIPPLTWTGKFFADNGLSLPHEHETPKSMVIPRTFRDIESHIRHIQRGLHGTSAVDIALQAILALLGTKEEASLPELKKSLLLLTKFARHSNFYAQTIPLSFIIQETALLREKTLSSLRITSRDADYAALMRAPYVNSGLFPGCTRKLLKLIARRKRSFSFYSRSYNAPTNSANRGGRRGYNYGQKQRRTWSGRPRQPFRQQQRGQPSSFVNQRGVGANRARLVPPVQTTENENVGATSVPEELRQAIQTRELELVGACLKGHQDIWAAKGASLWMQNLIRFGFKPTIPVMPPKNNRLWMLLFLSWWKNVWSRGF